MGSPIAFIHSMGVNEPDDIQPAQSYYSFRPCYSSPASKQSDTGKDPLESRFISPGDSLASLSAGWQFGIGNSPPDSPLSLPVGRRFVTEDGPSGGLSDFAGDSPPSPSTSWQFGTGNGPSFSLASPSASERSDAENGHSESMSNSLDDSLLSPPTSQQSVTPSGPSESLSSPPTSHSSGGEFRPPTIQSSENEVLSYLSLPRIFYPFTLCVSRPLTPQALTTYSPGTGLRHTLFHLPSESSGRPHIDHQTMVVSCAIVETESLGIYFGPNSRYNFSLLLHDMAPHNQSQLAAEIFAVHKTLTLARRIANKFGPDRTVLMRVVVVLCSEVVVNVMARWIDELNTKHWDRADEVFEGAEENRQRLVRLDSLVQDMVDDDGLEVMFWLVEPEDIVEAERLAYEELRGIPEGGFSGGGGGGGGSGSGSER